MQLGAGDWVYLERGHPHSLLALEDSSFLLTIMFK
jgi:quercetin dioxygenase-like cupin family protein